MPQPQSQATDWCHMLKHEGGEALLRELQGLYKSEPCVWDDYWSRPPTGQAA